MTIPQHFSPEHQAMWPQGLQDWVREVSPQWEDITSIQFGMETIDDGISEHGWKLKKPGIHRYVTLIASGETYKQTFKRGASGEWERVKEQS